MTYQIIIHGGANALVHETDERNAECARIVDAVSAELGKGMGAVDACVMAVSLLEDTPIFNAGTGSYLQLDGISRMDACLMASDLRLGAVIQIPSVKNPIQVARKLLDRPMHCTLAGEGASQFAAEMGFPLTNTVTKKQTEVLLTAVEKLEGNIGYDYVLNNYEKTSRNKLGTVGCVVRDDTGLIVAGTSTGGLEVCYKGRVGDTPLVGCGNYANTFAGVSCTGIGEKIMRLSLARLVTFYCESGDDAPTACKKAMEQMANIEGMGGIIAIDGKGNIGAEFNTKTMSFARKSVV